MTTWIHNTSGSDLVAPYGDFNNLLDISTFWDTSLDSVDVYENISGKNWDTDHEFTTTIDSEALKIETSYIGNGSYRYSKSIPVVPGKKYKITGTTVATQYGTTSIYGGSTLGGSDYFKIIGSGSGSDNDWEDHLSASYGNGTSTFTATTNTFYLRFSFFAWGGWLKFDNITLRQVNQRFSSKYPELTWHSWDNETAFNWSDW